MSILEFKTVDRPPMARASARSRWTPIIEALRKLPAGRALAVSAPDGISAGRFRSRMQQAILRLGGLRTETQLDEGMVFIWRKESGVAKDENDSSPNPESRIPKPDTPARKVSAAEFERILDDRVKPIQNPESNPRRRFSGEAMAINPNRIGG